MTPTTLQRALALAEEHNLPVFPCKADKSPLTEHGHLDASRNLDQIEAWWQKFPDALVGVPCGHDSKLLVVDVDPKGAQWMADHFAELGCSYIVKTPRGSHAYYRMPTNVEIKNSVSTIADGVDVRSDGGYVIQWAACGNEAVGDLDEIGPPPAWLLAQMTCAPKNARRETNGSASAESRIPDGQRGAKLASMAGTMRRCGFGEGAIYAALALVNSERCDPPVEEFKVRAIAKSIARYDPAPDHDDRPENPEKPTRLEEIRTALAADLEAGPEAIDRASPPQWISYPRLPVAGACLAAPGSTGKTTLVLYEMAHIAAGLQLYGDPVDQPGVCVYVSAEDGAAYPRYLLQRVLASGADAGALSANAVTRAKSAVRIIGWSRSRYGPVMTTNEIGEPCVCAVWPLLIELIAPLKPTYVTLDPSVLFGPGERHGNDAAAAFAALVHETAQQLGACVQTVDHVAQSVARNGIVDQYASRGGTGKVDESRLARQLVRVNENTEEPLPLGVLPADLADGNILRLHWTKPSYAPRPPSVWMRRRGYWFETLHAPSTEQAAEKRAAGSEQNVLRAEAAVLAYVRGRTKAGDRLGKRDIERSTIVVLETGDTLTVREAAEGVRRLLADGRLVRRELPPDDQNGFRRDYIDAP